MNRREFLRDGIGSIIALAAGKVVPDSSNDKEEAMAKLTQERDTWYSHCHAWIEMWREARRSVRRWEQSAIDWRDYALQLHKEKWGTALYSPSSSYTGHMETSEGEQPENWRILEWFEEPSIEWVRSEQGQVFFVGEGGTKENDGLAPDRALPSIKDALKKCDCSAPVVIHYGQCEGEQT